MKTKVKMKIEKHAKIGDLQRMKHYIRKYSIDLNAELTDFQTMMHIVCKKSHDHILRYLLRKGADVGLKDKLGNIPLHYALKLAISGNKYAYQDLVKPLLGPCSQLLDIPNNQGVTPRHLMDELVTGSLNRTPESSEIPGNSSREEDEEKLWSEKLSGEMEQEYSGSWGKYETDYFHELEDEMETHEKWSERMGEEYRKKHQPRRVQTGHRERKSKDGTVINDEARAEFQRKLEKEHEEYLRRAEIAKQQQLKLQKSEYESKWKSILENRTDNLKLSYSDIPWPPDSSDMSSVERFLLCDIDQDDQDQVRKYLREQQVRWHPDKFMQKLGNSLLGNKDEILEAVKSFSQIINSLYEKLP